ncbi:MAG: gamma-glutamylcyclotransferase family protein [Kovacikia sp.]
MSKFLKVFVYGTLKPGEINYGLCARYVVNICEAIAPGQLYALPLGYPAMIPSSSAPFSPQSQVHGFLLSFASPAILPILDQFEQHDPEELERYAPGQTPEQNQYERRLIEVFTPHHSALGSAWAYTMTTEQVIRLSGVLLTEGTWNTKQQPDPNG